jgi:hypothetical protein
MFANINELINPTRNSSGKYDDGDMVHAVIAAYEATNDTEQEMLTLQILSNSYDALSNAVETQSALVAKGYESASTGGVSPYEASVNAVATVLGISANSFSAGYEADAAAGKDGGGMLSKIMDAIISTAKSIYEFIKKQVIKVGNVFKSIFSSGKTTGDEIGKAVSNGEAGSDTDVATAEKELNADENAKHLVANDLSTIAILGGTEVNSDNIDTVIKAQGDLVKAIDKLNVKSKLLDVAKKVQVSAEKYLAAPADATLIAIFKDLIAELNGYSATYTAITKSAKIADKVEEKKKKFASDAGDGATAADVLTILTKITWNTVEGVLVLVRENSRGGVTFKTKKLDLAPSKEEIKALGKGHIKLAKSAELTKISTNLIAAAKDAKPVMEDLEKNASSDGDVVDKILNGIKNDLNKQLTGNKIKDKSVNDKLANVKDLSDALKGITTDIIPAITTGALATATSIVSSKVRSYVKHSLIKNLTKDLEK